MEPTPDILAVLAAYIDRRVDERVTARLRELQGPAPAEWLTTAEVAALKQRDAKTVRRWISEGLPARKHRGQWRVRRADLERWEAGLKPVAERPRSAAAESILAALHSG